MYSILSWASKNIRKTGAPVVFSVVYRLTSFAPTHGYEMIYILIKIYNDREKKNPINPFFASMTYIALLQQLTLIF